MCCFRMVTLRSEKKFQATLTKPHLGDDLVSKIRNKHLRLFHYKSTPRDPTR